jgi:hypothetical protein
MAKTIKIVNVETGEEIEREMTAAEIAQAKADEAEHKAQVKAEQDRLAEKAALLAKLGITENEAKLLFG